jgi:hypothetical protein
MLLGNATDCPLSDSKAGENKDNSDNSEEGDKDNDWSSQDTSLKAVVLNAMGNDLSLAVYLIPILQRSI